MGLLTQRRGGRGDSGVIVAADLESAAVQGDDRETVGERVVEFAGEKFALGGASKFGGKVLTAPKLPLGEGLDGVRRVRRSRNPNPRLIANPMRPAMTVSMFIPNTDSSAGQ